MAKRRRLTIATLLPGSDSTPASVPQSAVLPTRRPPIAEVAGEAAATSALQEMAERFERARAEGRMIQPLALETVESDYLVRDRLGVEEEAQEALKASIRARGQQVPVEVVALEGGRYGLISGWRRLAALRALHAETGDPVFETVLAILRRPADAADSYVAMVEENELRVGLSYYERARIVARAVEAGVYSDRTAALRGLFATASRARRSKIGSFLTIHAALDGTLRYPQAIPERLGLRLVQALEADPGLAARITADLHRRPPETAEAELARLTRLAVPPRPQPAPDTASRTTDKPDRPESAQTPADPTTLPIVTFEPERDRITLTGPGINAALARRLRAWLTEGQG